MCGIVGYADLHRRQLPERRVLERMAGALLHRGPDSDGYLIDGHVGMAARRLSIVDLHTGDQPISNEDGTVTVCCNGEIFNHQQLRRELRAAGHVFRTAGDVEVLVHLYEEHGDRLVDRLNGQFSFALYDRRRDRLLLARDQVGITPLHYSVTGGELVFGSEIKALLAHPRVRREVDLGGLDQVLMLPGLVSPRTMFAGIRSLPPGHLIVAEDGRVRVEQYWDLVYPPAETLTETVTLDVADHVARLEHALLQAVDLRMRADVPHAYYLSGGLDSSLIAAVAGKLASDRLNTYSVTFPDADLTERPFQQLVARTLDARHTEVMVTPQDLAAGLSDAVRHSECPLKESYNVASMRLSAAVRADGAKVVLTGEGADELFAGYLGYKFDKRRRVAPDERMLNRRLWGNPRLTYGQGLAHRAGQRAQLYSRDVAARLDTFDCLRGPLVDQRMLAGRHILHQRSYLDFKLRLADHLLGDHGDRVAMANSVETRYPYLDIGVIDVARRTPPDLSLRGFEEKYLLKRLADRYIPEQIINREKFAFHANTSADLIRLAESPLASYLSPARIRREGYFDPDAVQALTRRYADREHDLNVLFEDDVLMVVLTHGLLLEAFGLPPAS
ncbi:asparagine synthase (glutamine-hydrolyzing) [Plantactinospora sp. GCM10030261]|uniref:asparagine synthase (glutamine-hydrolyzing) n=1 Tax=Plantactinospora sp. GCM10030261 TaxID=3273420 RepID=UPI00360A7C8B